MCYPLFQQYNVEVMSISSDSVNDHKVWNETELSKMVCGGIQFPMLEDPGGAIARAYGVSGETGTRAARASFLIDPNGIIQIAMFLPSYVGPNIPSTINYVQALQLHAATGDSIPANWRPGRQTLKPDIRMAGHVWQIWRPQREC